MSEKLKNEDLSTAAAEKVAEEVLEETQKEDRISLIKKNPKILILIIIVVLAAGFMLFDQFYSTKPSSTSSKPFINQLKSRPLVEKAPIKKEKTEEKRRELKKKETKISAIKLTKAEKPRVYEKEIKEDLRKVKIEIPKEKLEKISQKIENSVLKKVDQQINSSLARFKENIDQKLEAVILNNQETLKKIVSLQDTVLRLQNDLTQAKLNAKELENLSLQIKDLKQDLSKTQEKLTEISKSPASESAKTDESLTIANNSVLYKNVVYHVGDTIKLYGKEYKIDSILKNKVILVDKEGNEYELGMN